MVRVGERPSLNCSTRTRRRSKGFVGKSEQGLKNKTDQAIKYPDALNMRCDFTFLNSAALMKEH
jgi:hypothetical protein